MPLPYVPGSHGPEIEYWQAWFIRNYRAYAPKEDGYYGDDEVTAVNEMQRRLSLPQTGVFDVTTASRVGYVPPSPDLKPIFFTVEGHMSDMFSGPVADTATQLEAEGLCRHQPIGYNNGSIPFDNQGGVVELARLVGATTLDTGAPFPVGTPWTLGGFSQGGIVVSDFYFDYLAPGKPLAWRTPDCKGYLVYGNPCRQVDSIAPWAQPWITKSGTHGLDPYRRFGLPTYPTKPDNWVDVYRAGDIFAENGDDKSSEIKAAVYQAVARSDIFSNPYSIAMQVVDLVGGTLNEVIGIVQAIISGISFLADNPNPHYSPYSIDGGVDWMRARLAS